MRVYDFPVAPVLIGLILGPMAETQLRRALAIRQGSPAALVDSSLSIVLLAVSLAMLAGPAVWRRLRPA